MTHRFSKLSKINVLDSDTWQNKLFLTFDIDWAHDDVIWDSFRLVESYGVETTWFVTHKTSFISLDCEMIEWGIHPNFNDCCRESLVPVGLNIFLSNY